MRQRTRSCMAIDMSDTMTFRDFAAALGDNQPERASAVLETLIGLDADRAATATAYFQAQMAADPMFIMKAMGMRQVVADRDEAQLVALLESCFGLASDEAGVAAKALLSRYP